MVRNFLFTELQEVYQPDPPSASRPFLTASGCPCGESTP
jgi:hypothetical protein